MSKVIPPFIPRPGSGPEKILKALILHWQKNLDSYLPGLKWADLSWNVAARHRARGQNEKVKNMSFTALRTGRSQPVPMHDAFIDFAKAYMVHQLTMSGEKNFKEQLSALRFLEVALRECSKDGVPRVALTDEIVADRGAEIIRSRCSTKAAQYGAGWRFSRLLEFLVKTGLVTRPFDWKSPFAPPDVGVTVGAEYERRRAALLPSREVLAAVGTIFDQATEERDIIATSCLALVCSAPERICETLTLPNHCEVWLENGDGSKDLGLRWTPAKGGKKGIKPICGEMAGVAAEAIERVRALTEDARRMAAWYEKNPDRLYLPKELEHLRQKELLNAEDLAALIGSRNAKGWMAGNAKQYRLTVYKSTVLIPNRWRKDGTRSLFRKQVNMYSFAEVESKVLGFLPAGFPWADKENGVKFSEALFVVKRGTFNPQTGAMPCMFAPVTLSTILTQFSSNSSGCTIFERFGLKNADGSRMGMTSKQARHWLNSMAERAGLSDLERDLWSGRRTGAVRNGEAVPPGRQSLSYLHNTVEELMEAGGLKPEDMDRSSSMAEAVARLPVSREEFLALKDKPAVHVTEFGICYHDFSMAPCQVHADCLNCTEHCCFRGDVEKVERIRQSHAIIVEQIQMARQLVEEGYLKAEPWYQHQLLTEKRLASLLEVLEDEAVLPHQPIFLANPFQYSPLRNAVLDRAAGVCDQLSLALAEKIGVPQLPLELLEWRVGEQP